MHNLCRNYVYVNIFFCDQKELQDALVYFKCSFKSHKTITLQMLIITFAQRTNTHERYKHRKQHLMMFVCAVMNDFLYSWPTLHF